MTNPSPAQWIGNAGDPVNGDWSDAADWTSDGLTPLGYVPGADNAVVLQDGAITYDTTDEIWSISGGVLDMTGGSLTIDNTSTGTNTIDVGTGATLTAASGASIELTGTIDGALAGAGGFVLDPGTTIGSGADLTASSFAFNGANVTSDLTYTGAGLTINGSGFNAGLGVTDGATFTITADDLAFGSSGQIGVSDSGTLVLDTDQTGAGVITLASFGTADIKNFANGTIIFLDGRGDLILQQPTSFTGTIAGFQQGDKIDLITPSVVTSVAYIDPDNTPSGGVLTAYDGTAVVASLQLLGNYTTSTGLTFSFTPDASGTGYDLYMPCYRRGTRIQTAQGETLIEQLAIGDTVMTTTGHLMPIRWIGRRSYSGGFAARNIEVLPVLIRAGALADDLPRRDLWVSPEHAMYVDGMLIAARDLVNGESIIQVEAVDEVTYFHLEFDTHAVIYAEGAPSESFVDDESREMFDNAAEYARLYPRAVRTPAHFCAPRVDQGWELEAVRRRLVERAARVATAFNCDPTRPPIDLRANGAGIIARSLQQRC